MKVRPLGDKILVKRDEAATKTDSGIFLPESAKDKPKQGKVMAVGNGILNKDKGTYVPFTVKKGDTVIFSSYSGTAQDRRRAVPDHDRGGDPRHRRVTHARPRSHGPWKPPSSARPSPS